MKVLLLNGADQGGGSFQMAKSLLKFVPRYDEDVHYILVSQKYGHLNQWCNENDIENYTVPYRYCVYRPMRNRAISFLKHQVKKLIVSVQNMYAIYKIESMGILDDVDVIHTNINRDLFGMALSKRHGIPNITHLREFSKAHFHLEPLYKNQILYMNENTARFVAITNTVRDDWVAYGIDGAKTTVVYDGVDFGDIPEHSERESAGLRVVMSGAIYEGKGQLQLVKAVVELLEENPSLPITVDFYGECVQPNYQAAIEAYVADSGLQSHFCFKGYHENVRELLADYDVGVVCSAAEGFGLATVEFLMAGLIVIACDTGANAEILENGLYGHLYTLGDHRQLANLLLQAYCEENRRMSHASGKHGSTYAKERFSIIRTAEQIAKEYGSLC